MSPQQRPQRWNGAKIMFAVALSILVSKGESQQQQPMQPHQQPWQLQLQQAEMVGHYFYPMTMPMSQSQQGQNQQGANSPHNNNPQQQQQGMVEAYKNLVHHPSEVASLLSRAQGVPLPTPMPPPLPASAVQGHVVYGEPQPHRPASYTQGQGYGYGYGHQPSPTIDSGSSRDSSMVAQSKKRSPVAPAAQQPPMMFHRSPQMVLPATNIESPSFGMMPLGGTGTIGGYIYPMGAYPMAALPFNAGASFGDFLAASMQAKKKRSLEFVPEWRKRSGRN